MNTLHNELIVRKAKLQQVATALKEQFLGLDSVIDEIITMMMAWYIFPEAQLRPTIINLWGLTGSGKTALVQRIVELLDYKKLYSHMDMGEFESDSSSWIKHILTDDLDYFDQKPALLCLDEFQFAKTLDGDNNELGKDKLRVIWDLLDSGKIEYVESSGNYYLFKADNCVKRLEQAIKSGVVVEQGEVIREVETFRQIFDHFYFNYANRNSVLNHPAYFLSQDFIEAMEGLYENEYSQEKIRQHLKSLSIDGIREYIIKAMQTRPAMKTLDLSRSLIFVLGNLDEAYTMSRSMNPDISADEFHEQTSKITIADIKRALRKRFRSEQIARLGDNHVIYKSFNNAQFRELIKRELAKISAFVKDQFSWNIHFDESITDIVYAEGVFPTQGTRPVFSTVKNLIESRISTVIVAVLEKQLPVNDIHWTYSKSCFNYTLKDRSGNTLTTISDKAILKLENLRKSIDPEIQAHTAVHEAGHAILAALTLRIVPSVVVTRTASDMEGFCLINFPKGPMTRESLKKDIIITLGGYVAEKMIFGEEFTSSGVYLDVEEASALANKAIRKYAMGSDPIHLAVESTTNEDAFYHSEAYHAQAVSIIKACESEATRLLQRNKFLLLKMADYLTHHSRMEEAQIASFVKAYSTESWVSSEGFILKDEYYQFHKQLKNQIREMQQEEELPPMLDSKVLKETIQQ